MKESAKDYLNMKANRKMIQQKFQESTGKIVTLQDLTNMKKSNQDQSKKENLDNCLNILKAKHGKLKYSIIILLVLITTVFRCQCGCFERRRQ